MAASRTRDEDSDLGGTHASGCPGVQLTAGHPGRSAVYGTRMVRERHRHRYEFNNRYR